MGNIARHTGKNIGGLCRLSWVYQEDVSGITFLLSSLYSQVALKPGKQWNTLYGTPETIQLDSEQQDTPAGMKYIYKVKALVPKDRIAVEAELFRMSSRRLILKVDDKNGTVRFLGTLECPMKLTAKLLKPASLETFNGFELLFSGEFAAPASYEISSSGIPGGGDPD